MNESSIQVTIAGRTYPLTVAEGEAKSVRDAAGRIDEIVQRFQRDYGVSDRQDLLAMAALQLLSDTAGAPQETSPEASGLPSEVFDGLEEVRSLLAQAGIAPEDGQGQTP
ncbi:MAG: cell division protein ZapA [Flavobacteriales bacterium]|jgi:cell division protein ZapA|nr:cell division protein ZapA [Flavobacteriales bacterium]